MKSRVDMIRLRRFIFVFLAVVCVCFVLFAALTLALRARGAPCPLDMTTGFSVKRARAVVAAYSAEARALLDVFQAVDLVFPPAYVLFFISWAVYLLKKFDAPGPWFLLCVAPLAAGLFDLIENVGIFVLLRSPPASFEAPALIASKAGVLKMVFFAGSVLLVAVLSAVRRFKRIRTNSKSRKG